MLFKSFKTRFYKEHNPNAVLTFKTHYFKDEDSGDRRLSHTKSFLKEVAKSRDFSGYSFITGLFLDSLDEKRLKLPKRLDFSESRMVGSRFHMVTMKKASFMYAELSYTRAYHVNLKGAEFDSADLCNCYFYQSDLTNTSFVGTTLDNVLFEGCHLNGADFTGVDLVGARFSCCQLEGLKVGTARHLVGTRPILRIEPVGNDNAPIVLTLTNEGPYVERGCFYGTLEEFEKEVRTSDNHFEGTEPTKTGAEYLKVIELFQAHTEQWHPGVRDRVRSWPFPTALSMSK